MKSLTQPVWRRAISSVAAATTIACLLSVFFPSANAQSRDRWVGTWATAEVSRNQNPNPPTGLPGLAPFMANSCPAAGGGGGRAGGPAANAPAGQAPAPAAAAAPAAPAAPAPFLHFTDQTIRQIVRTSIGGTKARIMVSNTFGTAPVKIGAASIALRDKEGRDSGNLESPNHVQRQGGRDRARRRRVV